MQHHLTEKSLRSKIAAYLFGHTSLSELYDWFVAAAWDIHLGAPATLQKTVHEIQYIFDEYSYGSRSEPALKEKLRPFVTSVTVESAVPATTGSVQSFLAASKAKAKRTRRISTGRFRMLRSSTPAIRKQVGSAAANKTALLNCPSSTSVFVPNLLVVPSGHDVPVTACS